MTQAPSIAATAAALDRRLATAAPRDVVAEAQRTVGPGRLAVVSSFGIEAAALLQIVADVDRAIPVLFLDTGWLFSETLAYRDALVARLGLTDVRALAPAPATIAARDPERDLWFTDPDACCALRKVEPLGRALENFDGWINGRKRYHGGDRAQLPMVEVENRRLKFNPLARATRADIDRAFAATGLPRHPLERLGFASVGCMPCTSRAEPGEAVRAGRWRGRGRSECGIHSSLTPASTPRESALG